VWTREEVEGMKTTTRSLAVEDLEEDAEAETAVEVVVNDGDVLFFRGDRVFHSVDGLVAEPPERRDWARNLLPEGAEMGDDGYAPGRLALLFREERETQGKDAR